MIHSRTTTASASWGTSASDRRHAGPSPIRALLLASVSAACLVGQAAGQELPTGGTVAHGNVNIAQPGPGSMTITQGTNSAIVNWNSFSIGSGGHVDIRQPDANASMLNRVTGSTTSAIHGRLTANGNVHLVNPNGIFIGPNGTVDAGGFVASTLDITNDDFVAGRLRYSGQGNSATVENAGHVTIGRDGYAALLGGRVRNSGVVAVPMGRIAFGSGERAVLDLGGDQFLQVAVPTGGEDGEEALIENSGLASAQGGLIEMRAATAREAVRQAVNLSGVAEARSVSVRNGAIVLGGGGGGTVNVTGRVSTRSEPSALIVDASKRPPESPEITVTGRRIQLAGAEIDASIDGGGGLIRIGGDFAGAGDLPRADEVFVDDTTTIRADALGQGDGGRIAVWSEMSTEFAGFLSARGGDAGGDGGFVEVSSRRTLSYSGLADRRAPHGKWGTLLLDPTDITVNPGAGANNELDIESNLALGNVVLDTTSGLSEPGDITINADIDWSAATTLSLVADGLGPGDGNIAINGAINGSSGGLDIDADGTITATGAINVNSFVLNDGSWEQFATAAAFAANSFSIDQSDASFARTAAGDGTNAPAEIFDIFGLQGIGTYGTDFVLANDINGAGTSSWSKSAVDGFEPIDGFGGTFDGAGFTVSNLFQSQNLSNAAGFFDIIGLNATVTDLTLANGNFTGSGGGILANGNDGTILRSRVSGALSTDGSDTGGFVGFNFGLIEDSISGATVNSAGGANFVDNIGGFVGFNVGTINRSHATGSVNVTNTDPTANVQVGGFVGQEGGGLTVSDSYAQGDVTVSSSVGSGATVIAGGFVGFLDGSALRNYSTGAVNVSGDATVAQGGFAGDIGSSGGGTGNFWDTQTSGQGSSAFGIPLTTADFQNTETFISNAAAFGWDFASTWAPGDTGFYPVNYSTSPVILGTPADFTTPYGTTATATTPGSVAGGPGDFVFDESTDTLDTSTLFDSLTYPAGETVGTQPFGLATANLASADGVNYRVIDRLGIVTIAPAPLTITPTDQTKTFGTTFAFNGTEFTTSGLVPGDIVAPANLSSAGAPASAPLGSYQILVSGASGPDASNYTITTGTGTMTVEAADTDIVPRPPVVITPGLTNPPDSFEYNITIGSGPAGGQIARQNAAETFAQVQNIAESLEIAADSCGQSGGDVGRYLACLSDALDDFAGELDAISLELPPGMENVAQIIQTARTQIDGAATRAAARLATATTEAERQAIRRDAANEARSALNNASNEIRKAITLVRAEDPELASLQRATITTVASAVDTVGIELARVTDL